ncbi:hypothetical protein T265_05105 [Opisthorchis viverrini]|uniref:Uncharacterized protein n=1 Tax=Opisthorchis viverrini TaxID=6198 RepID=A0A074ZLM3_OPIVI|nr:hypothetical protein T265_05105 [Opisthorchis viverrini]KER27986.1 hypothetical protein T265_05105 [Opisthorchis viverrini]
MLQSDSINSVIDITFQAMQSGSTRKHTTRMPPPSVVSPSHRQNRTNTNRDNIPVGRSTLENPRLFLGHVASVFPDHYTAALTGSTGP